MSFTAIELSVRQTLARVRESIVLAVSGGVDSMVLLHAAARAAPEHIAAVATFDHGTGKHARDACKLVIQTAHELGVRVVSARAASRLKGESDWREARWKFLRQVAMQGQLQVATAHTRDDHIETVAMRIMRGSGARGLAGLYARGDVVRPLLEYTRVDMLAYASHHEIRYAEDPTNSSRAYLRNRLRLEIIPALRRVDQSLDEKLLAVSRRAAHWRDEVEELVATFGMKNAGGSRYVMNLDSLAGLDEEELKVLLPAIAARAGVTMDRRGVKRGATLLLSPRARGRIQLSGGFELEKRGDALAFTVAQTLDPPEKEIRGDMRWGRWFFRRVTDAPPRSQWIAWLPSSPSRVRAWRAGDRLLAAGVAHPRRVKRFLSDSGISGADRRGWPVVLVGDEIVWVPGVRKSLSAERGDYQLDGVDAYACERID